jgi:hypothetical protein
MVTPDPTEITRLDPLMTMRRANHLLDGEVEQWEIDLGN